MPATPRLALLVLLLANVIWGGSYVAAKIALADLSPASLAFLRFALAAVIAVPLAWRVRADLRLRRHDIYAVAVIGVLGVALSYLVGYLGMNWTTASDAALVISAEPLFTVMLAVVFLSEPLGWRRAGALALGMAGAYIIVGNGRAPGVLLSSRQAIGNLLVVASLLGEAGYTVLGKHIMRTNRPLVVTLYAIWIGAAVLLPVTLVLHAPGTPHQQGNWTAGLLPTSGTTWLALVYLSAGCTIGAYLLWNVALTRVQANVASVFLFVQPVVGALLGVLILHDPLTIATLLGSGAIFVAVLSAER